LQFFKIRIAPELREKSEYLTRGTNNIYAKTDISKFNKDKQIEKNNYIHFAENSYKSMNSNKVIENIVRISIFNPLTNFKKSYSAITIVPTSYAITVNRH